MGREKETATRNTSVGADAGQPIYVTKNSIQPDDGKSKRLETISMAELVGVQYILDTERSKNDLPKEKSQKRVEGCGQIG